MGVLGELAYFCLPADSVHVHASVFPPIKPSAHISLHIVKTGLFSGLDSWQNKEWMDAKTKEAIRKEINHLFKLLKRTVTVLTDLAPISTM